MTTEAAATAPAVAPGPTGRATAEHDGAQRVFSLSILLSAVRCTLTYVVLPWVAPLVGLASGVGPLLGLVVGLVAIVFNGASIRRFWRAAHPWRVKVTVLNSGIIALLVVLVAIDLAELAG